MRPNPHVFILAATCAAALTACGGGGLDDTADNAATPAEFRFAEFLGTWIGTECRQDPWGGFFRLSRVVITEKTMEMTRTGYDADAACRLKAGQLIEKFDITWSAGSVADKTHVARATTILTGTSMDGDMRVLESPIGTVEKLLLDVDGDKLYGPANDALQDADGFPTALYPISIATRQ